MALQHPLKSGSVTRNAAVFSYNGLHRRQTAPYAWGGIPVIRQGPCDAPEKPCHKPTCEDQTAFKPIRCITSTKLFGARRPHTPAKPGFQFQTLPTKNAIQQDVQRQSGGLMQTGHARVPSRGSGLAQIGLRRKRTLHIHLRLGYFEPFDSSPGELRADYREEWQRCQQ
jgi:hypothetical protein